MESKHISLQLHLVGSDGKDNILENQARPLRNHCIFYSISHTARTETRAGIELGHYNKF